MYSICTEENLLVSGGIGEIAWKLVATIEIITMAQNQILLTCFQQAGRRQCLCSDRCRALSLTQRTQMHENGLRQEIDLLDALENGHLDNIWQSTTQKLIAGVSLYQKATARAGLNSFGSSLTGVPWYNTLDERERSRLCRRVNQMKRIWDAWPDIIENLTRPSILYIDVRSFSMDKLEKAINYDWVKDRNASNNPEKIKKKDPVLRGYPQQMITDIMAAINTTGILQVINHDEEQVKLILKDIKEGISDLKPN